jgi:hypothetical protein
VINGYFCEQTFCLEFIVSWLVAADPIIIHRIFRSINLIMRAVAAAHDTRFYRWDYGDSETYSK